MGSGILFPNPNVAQTRQRWDIFGRRTLIRFINFTKVATIASTREFLVQVRRLGSSISFWLRLDNAIHWINLYPVNNLILYMNTYPLDSVICPLKTWSWMLNSSKRLSSLLVLVVIASESGIFWAAVWSSIIRIRLYEVFRKPEKPKIPKWHNGGIINIQYSKVKIWFKQLLVFFLAL